MDKDTRKIRSAFRRCKSMLILLLAALAIYLTGQLWFVHLANRNFFLDIVERFNPSISEGYREFVRPMRMVYGSGNGRFEIIYSGLMDNDARRYFDTVLTELFARGVFVGEGETDYNRLLTRPVVIYEHAFWVPSDIFPLGFNQRTGTFLIGRGIDEFIAVAIWPPYGDDTDLRVFFIGDGVFWEFIVDSPGSALHLPIHHVSAASFHHVSAVLEGYEDLPPWAFVPRPGELGRAPFFPVIVTNPYLNHIGERTLPNIRIQVAHFFDNPAAIMQRVAGDAIWTFSTNHATVRYFYTDVLEFSSFRPRRRNITSSFLEDFSVAWSFALDDYHVINEFYLTGYEPRGAGYVFWFGYIIDNFPIIMPIDGWSVSSQEDILLAPIEVIVEQGRVVRYRRIVHNFRHDLDHEPVWLDFDLDNLLMGLDGEIENIILGYPMRSQEELRLEWIVISD